MTVDPLHLIRIMPAQGYGCERTAYKSDRICVGAHLFPVGEKVGFLL